MAIGPINHDDNRPYNQTSDELLITTLMTVVKASVEYNKSVSELINSDVDKRARLEQLKDSVDDILYELKTLTKSHEELSKQVDIALEFHRGMVNKFKPLYVYMGLKEDGSEFSPTDKLVVKFKQVFFHKVSMILAGALLTVLIKFFMKHGISS